MHNVETKVDHVGTTRVKLGSYDMEANKYQIKI